MFDRDKVREMLVEAGKMCAGEENGFVGAYLIMDEDGSYCDVAEGGSLIAVTWILAKIILGVAASHEEKPMDVLKYVRRALSMLVKYHKKGVPIGEFESVDCE